MILERLLGWIAREGWLGLAPMLVAAAWLAREAWKLRRERERLHISRMFHDAEAAKHQRQIRYLKGEFDDEE